jgi:serine/threonine-protein kinase RsbT
MDQQGHAEECRIRVQTDSDVVRARQMAREMASALGFRSSELTIIALAISELARNILQYAKHGEIILKKVNSHEPPGIDIVASDKGPGIADIHMAMKDGFSTSGSLGLGLPGVKRLMDEFEIISVPGQGTTVSARKWKR